jgi:hypothetical protein
MPIEATIVRLKREYPGWGAPKIREKLRQQLPTRPHCPAISTVHAVLDRHGLVHRRRRATGTALSQPIRPRCDAPTIRASSCWGIAGTATRSRSPTSPAAISDLRSALDHAGDICIHDLRMSVQGIWVPGRDAD